MSDTSPKVVLPDTGDWSNDAFMVKISNQFGSYREAVIRGSQVFHSFGDATSSKLVEQVSNNVDGAGETSYFDLKGSASSPWYFALGKVRDTTLGGNDVVNPLHQYCRYDDVIPPFNSNFSSGCTGEGRVYSKVIDDNQRILYLSFGIPVFNSLMAFYANAADEKTSNLNDHGFIFNGVKKMTAMFVTPASLVVKLPVLPFVWLQRLTMFDDAPITKYYDFQSQMPMYYRYVNTILISLAVNMNLLKSLPSNKEGYGSDSDFDGNLKASQANDAEAPQANNNSDSNTGDNKKTDTTTNTNTTSSSNNNTSGTSNIPTGTAGTNGFSNNTNWSGTHAENFARSGDAGQSAWPDYLVDYQLDVGQILHKRQVFIYGSKIRKQDVATDSLVGAEGGYGKSPLSAVNTVTQSISGEITDALNPKSQSSTGDQVDENESSNFGIASRISSGFSLNTSGDVKDGDADGFGKDNIIDKSNSTFPKYLKQLFDGFKAGAQPALYLPLYYVGFRVERGVDTQESLQNQVGQSSVQQMLNQKFDSGREKLFGLARGHLGNASGLLGAGLDIGADILGGIVAGVSSSVGLSGLAALATGSGLIDIPQEWKNSEFRKDYSFTMKFRASTGNKLSIFQSIMYPLSFLMAGSFPRAQGMASYGSPFLCKAFCKGMLSVPLGMITSLSIQRGSDVNGWSIDNLPTEVGVHFTISDLTPIMYMAMGNGGVISGVIKDLENALLGTVDSFNEYLSTLSGLGLDDRFGSAGLARRCKTFENTLLTARFNRFDLGMAIGSSTPVRALSFLIDVPGKIAHGDVGWSSFGGPNVTY